MLFFSATVAIGAVNENLQSGINAFQAGKFEEAKGFFSESLKSPSWKFAALYNLGNIAVRQGHWGEALGYYARAQRQNPHDRDTRDNIQFVFNQLGGKRLTAAPGNFEIFRSQILDRFTFNEALACLLLVSLYFLIKLLKQIRLWRTQEEQRKVTTSLIFGGVLLFIILALSSLKLIDSYSKRGTIISNHAELRSGPGEANASMLDVSEGTEVAILDSDHDWFQVSPIGGSLVGWVPSSSIMVTAGGGPF
jgi:tetratricopeptide (TPR) repeat protein